MTSSATTTESLCRFTDSVACQPSVKEIRYLVNKYGRGIGLAILVPGIVLNVFNLRAFWRMGLKDTVTVVFFHLTIADLFVLISGGARFSMWYLNNPIVLSRFIPVRIIRSCALAVQLTSFEANTCLTTFLAVQRCLCVALPLRFKSVFGLSRTSGIVLAMWAVSLVHLSLRTYYTWLDFTVHTLPNSTVTSKVTWDFPALWHVSVLVLTVIDVFLRPICSVLVIVCVVVMVTALKRSARFLKAASTSTC